MCGEPKAKEWFVLCNGCYQKMQSGRLIGIKSESPKWKVHTREGWVNLEKGDQLKPDHVYQGKRRLVTENEARFFPIIRDAAAMLCEEKSYNVFPQVALSSLVQKEESIRGRNELFRSVDFLIANQDYAPLLVVEINDSSHDKPERVQRDQDLKVICGEAGIPVVFLDGRKDAPLISAEDLLRKLRGALWDLENLEIPTYLYSVIRPEVKSNILQDTPQLPPRQSELEEEVEAKTISNPQAKATYQITSKIGSANKKNNAKRPGMVSNYYSKRFFRHVVLGLLGYVLGFVFCIVISHYNTLGGIFCDSAMFIGLPFGWSIAGEFLPKSIILRGFIGLLIGVAYPIVLIYYFIRMILEFLHN